MISQKEAQRSNGTSGRALRTALVLLTMVGIASAIQGCGDDDSFAVTDKVELLVDPPTIVFRAAAPGDTTRATLTVFNQSKAQARLNFALREHRNNDSNREFDWGEGYHDILGKTVELEGGDNLQIVVEYTPQDTSRDSGEIHITYNGGEIVIPMETNEISADIDGPSRVLFGRVAPGTSQTKTLTIQNVGHSPLALDRFYFSDNTEEFSFCFPQPSVSEDEPGPCLAEDESGARPDELARLETLEVLVRYAPVDEGEDLTALKIDSNDPDEQPFEIDIVANGAEPCIVVTEEAGVDFGAAYIGGVAARTMTISNCSPNKELEVSGIRMLDGSDPEFYVDALPGGLNDDPITVDIGGTASFVLNYAPTAEAANAGELEIRSNDVAKDPLVIPVNGRGSNNVCPTAAAKARVGQNPWGDQLEVLPLDTVTFDASDSTDPDNPGPEGIRSYEWTIVERPTDSTTQFSPNNSVANPGLFIDLAGRYVIELTVYDDSNLASCEPARVTLIATPNEDIHVQLVWDTDGTDVDLHFLHPSGRWDASPHDCYWLNREPNWANLGARNDDPSLDIDDVDGFGPENINLDNPENVTYRVGVFYFSDHARGASNSTMRIWLGGTLVFEYRGKYMTDRQFWDVATIDWGPQPQVNQIDNMFNGFP